MTKIISSKEFLTKFIYFIISLCGILMVVIYQGRVEYIEQINNNLNLKNEKLEGKIETIYKEFSNQIVNLSATLVKLNNTIDITNSMNRMMFDKVNEDMANTKRDIEELKKKSNKNERNILLMKKR